MSSKRPVEGGRGSGFPKRLFALGVAAILALGAGAWLALDVAGRPAAGPVPSFPASQGLGPGAESRPPAGAPEAPARPHGRPPFHTQLPQPAPEEPAMLDAPRADGPTGLAAFPPMGTKPIQRGILVPDGFELPPGYVRHYQTTDSGEHLPAILKFHPDYTPTDAAGHKLAIPKDRIVPPELAPAGLPIRYLEMADGPDGSGQPR